MSGTKNERRKKKRRKYKAGMMEGTKSKCDDIETGEYGKENGTKANGVGNE